MVMLMTSGGRQVEGSANLTPRGPAQGLRRLLSFVWAFLPVLSFGYLAPIPIIHAAVKLRTWTLPAGDPRVPDPGSGQPLPGAAGFAQDPSGEVHALVNFPGVPFGNTGEVLKLIPATG
jgi:hypothetical protein